MNVECLVKKTVRSIKSTDKFQENEAEIFSRNDSTLLGLECIVSGLFMRYKLFIFVFY